MITVNSSGQALSADYSTALTDDNRQWLSKFSVNGTELDCSIVRWSLTKGSCGGSEFEVGAVMSSTFTATVKGLTTNIKNQDIKVEIGLYINSDYEWITLGYFTATEVKKTHYQTQITAYGHCVSKTGDVLSMSTTQTLANIKNAISSATGVNVSMDASIDGTLEITQDLAGLTTYQVLQILASVVGGYAMDEADGSISVRKYGTTSSLTVGTDRMLSLPDVEETNFTITGIEVTAGETTFTSGTVNLQITNEFVTQDLFDDEMTDLIGYSYRPASINLSKGDPRLEGDDVVTVTDIGGSTYIVPCHAVTHSYDGGLSTTIASIRATMANDLEGTSAPISTQIKAQEKQIIRIDRIASNTNQYFWFTGTGTDTGAHITEVPQEEWNDSTDPNYHSGGNLLARSNGIAVRDGMTELATFGTSTVIGKTGDTHIEMDYHSFKMIDRDGREYAVIEDLRNADGYYSVTQTWTADGVSTEYLTQYTIATNEPYTVSVSDGSGGAVTVHPAGSIEFATPPTEQATITFEYLTAFERAKAYTFGIRTANSELGPMSFAEGAYIEASGQASHAEGSSTVASANESHAEGYGTKATGRRSHAEGHETEASEYASHAEGYKTIASGWASHAQGYYTIASGFAQTVMGEYNVEDSDYFLIIGNGANNNARSNALAVTRGGNIHISIQNYTTSGNIDKTIYDALVALGWSDCYEI